MLARETLVVGTETPSFFHTMTPAFAAIECLTALVAARRGTQTIKSLAASEKQLEAFDTYLPATRKRTNRS
jgi:DNA-binding MurR/RpiR family transcriptional regulator